MPGLSRGHREDDLASKAGEALDQELGRVGRASVDPTPAVGFEGDHLERGLQHGRDQHAIDEVLMRERAIRDIAGLLTALRAIPVGEARSWGVVDDDPRPGYAEDLELARLQVYPLVEPSVRDHIERFFDTYLSDDDLLNFEPALLHAALASDHIRYAPDSGRITGVIDWGDASIGDLDYELSYLFRDGGAGFVAEVVRHGPPRDEAKLERKLRFFSGHDTIDTLLIGLERGDDRLATEALATLRADAATAAFLEAKPPESSSSHRSLGAGGP